MSARNEIINAIRAQSLERVEMPDLDHLLLPQENNEERFIQACESVGGKVVQCGEAGGSLRTLINELYPEAKSITSNFAVEGLETIHPDTFADAHQLNNIDIAIVEGQFGVAENGAIWITNSATKHRTLYFIAENLIILLDRSKLVSTMHDAYARIDDADYEFGVFISGPSKTADIEQALVIGAHGARAVMVVMCNNGYKE